MRISVLGIAVILISITGCGGVREQPDSGVTKPDGPVKMDGAADITQPDQTPPKVDAEVPDANNQDMLADASGEGIFDLHVDTMPDTAPPLDTAPSPDVGPKCGDKVKNGSEVCDDTDLDNKTCKTQGFDDGTLKCASSCLAFDTTGCYKCGDGKKNGLEQCDGTDLNNKQCSDLNYFTGSLSCTSTCVFNTTLCTNCGNAKMDSGEQCDGTNLNSKTCSTQGYDGGTLACTTSCSAFDTANCYKCGDAKKNGSETCDGTDLDNKTCITQGYDGGTLACATSCTAFDTAKCYKCGDAKKNGPETCDGADLDKKTCITQGFDSGTLACAATCTAFVTTGCNKCGDGKISGPEKCDGSLLGGATCQSENFDSGTLKCNSTCTALDTSGCGKCGDGKVNGTEKCDGSQLGGYVCKDAGSFDGGTLKCNASCAHDTSKCYKCTSTFYVNATQLDDKGDGCTPATAKKYIASGIKLAEAYATPGNSTVLVAPGLYTGPLNTGLAIGKSISLKSNGGNAIIDCKKTGRGLSVTGGAPTIIGFTIRNCTVSGSSGGSKTVVGGGVACSNSSPSFINCIISGNSASKIGGGSNTIRGGGIYSSNCNMLFSNCAIIGNTANYSGGGGSNSVAGGGLYSSSSSIVMNNTIIWGNKGGAGSQIYSSQGTTLNYCVVSNGSGDLAGGGVTLSNSLYSDPKFKDTINADYHLNSASPCIGAGSNALVPSGITTDLDGKARIQGGKVDIGAYEGSYVDVTPPTIKSTTPKDLSSAVSVSSVIVVEFSEPMDKTTTEGAFSITPTITGKYSWTGNTMTFTPDSKLPNDKTYTCSVGTSAKDVNGNNMASLYSFTFTTIEIVPPTITATNPAANASGVPVTSTVSVVFSEPMNKTSAESAFSIPTVTGTFSWNNNTMVFTPQSNFLSARSYACTVSTAAKDLVGNSMKTQYSWSFTTK